MRRGDLAACGLLAAAVVGLFPDVVLGSRVFFERDILAYWVPQIESLVRILAAGSLPLWNPYFSFGLPLLGDPSYQLYYPPTWLNLLVSPATYINLYVTVHTLWAGIGTYLLAGRLQLAWAPRLLAATLFMASGPLVSLSNNVPHFGGAVWTPWVLCALERLLAAPTLRSASLLGGAAALQILTGSGDMVLLTAMLATGRVTVWLALARPWTAERTANVIRAGILAVVLAVLLSAAQVLPTLAILGAGARTRLPPASNAYWSVHPLLLADLVVPRLFSDLPLSSAWRAVLFESREPFLRSLYLGLPAFWLVLLGLGRSARRSALLAALAFFLVAALGRHAPLHGWLLHLPAVGMFRYPVKYLIPASLVFSLLAGVGLATWQAAWGTAWRQHAFRLALLAALAATGLFLCGEGLRALPASISDLLLVGSSAIGAADVVSKLRTAAAVTALCAGLLLARLGGRRLQPLATAGIVGLAVLDLTWANHSVNPSAPRELLAKRPPIVDVLGAAGALPRVYVHQETTAELNRMLQHGPAGWEPRAAWALGLVDMLAPPSGARFGVLGSYDGDFTGLAPAGHSTHTQIVGDPRAAALARTLLRLGNVGYVVSLQASAFGLPEVARLDSVFSRPIRVSRVADPQPLAYLAAGWVVRSEEEAWRGLASPEFDVANQVVLGAAEGHLTPPVHGTVRVLEQRPGRLRLETDADVPAYLVAVQTFFPGWEASVDGTPAPVLEANQLFCAVATPPGRHSVELRYRSPSALAGLVISAIGLCVTALIWTRRPASRTAERE